MDDSLSEVPLLLLTYVVGADISELFCGEESGDRM